MSDATAAQPVAAPGSLNALIVPPDQWSDPHPHYHRVRAATPVLAIDGFDDLVLTRYEDCERVLRDPAFSSDDMTYRRQPLRRQAPEGMEEIRVRSLLNMDPPDHTRLRGLVSKAFTPRSVERLRPHVADLVGGFLDAAEARARDGDGSFDVIADLGYPLPVTVICEMLGVPVEDRDLFGPWSHDGTRLLDADIDDETLQRGVLAMMQIVNYISHLFDERRADPRDDMISALLAVEEGGDRLSEEELRSIVLLLFVAGHETTMNLIGNGMVALMRNRDQWARLCADPALAPSAVEELLRYDGPVHLTGRVATRDIDVGGVTVEAGQGVVTLLAAANRDPERFPDPDRLDLARADGPHLTFSHGIHYCLGAALARLEGQEVLGALARRLPDAELAEEPVHREHFVLRGYREVLVHAGS
jgi:cytochrome P450